MSLLLDGLPTAIEIDGTAYAINSDYKTCLMIITAFEDNELTGYEKIAVLLDLLYKERPGNIEQAVKMGIRFLDCGEETTEGETGSEQPRRYSFAHDDKYIFSGVDKVLCGRLSKGEPVHWWEFVMAFMELPEDCMMSKIIYYRTQKAKGKLTKEEQRVYYENRDVFDLPVELAADEQKVLDEFMSLLNE